MTFFDALTFPMSILCILDGTFMFSAMKQVKQLKISGWPTIFGRDQKNLSFWPFLVWDICTSHFEPEKLDRVGRGAQEWPKSVKIWLLLCGLAIFGEKPIFFHFWSKLVQITQKWSQMVQKWCLTVFYHLGPFLNDLDQLGSKTEILFFLPKIANPQSKHSETRYF